MEHKEKLADFEKVEKQIRSDEMAACKMKNTLWTKALMSGNKKAKLKKFESPDQEKRYLYQKMTANKATSGELVRLSFLWGMVTDAEYKDYLEIEKECEKNEDF